MSSCFSIKTQHFGNWILSPKRCVSIEKQDDILNEDKTMDNVLMYNCHKPSDHILEVSLVQLGGVTDTHTMPAVRELSRVAVVLST
jgi:hypothetical protein